MGQYNAAVITTAGESIIAQALQGTSLTWTAMRASSTAIPSGTNLKALTSISGVQQTAEITSATVYNDTTVQVLARFANTGINAPYYIRTVGIYGTPQGGSETLIAVMTAVTPDEVPAYDADSPAAFIFAVQLTVQSAASVTMQVNDSGTATVAEMLGKVDAAGGNISDTKAVTISNVTTAYPAISANTTMAVILGRIKKFLADLKANCLAGLSASGTVITYTRADGTTGTITTQDTTYGNATTTAAGLMTAADKAKLDGIAAGAQVNSVTGVKGNAESTYRTGNVNITPANIGAAAASHNHSASNINSGTLSADRLPTVPLTKGGTGATSAAAARTNLGVMQMASGTAAPTTSTCPSGCVYFQYTN